MRPQLFYLSILFCCLQSNPVRAFNNLPLEQATYKISFNQRALTNDVFVEQAILGNLAELELAKAALQKTKDPKIQNFAQRMIIENTIAANELTQIARNTAIDVPYQLDSAGMESIRELDRLFGGDFDTAFAVHMYAVQAQTLSLFTTAVHDTALQGVLRLFAIKMLSTLQGHRLAAEDLTKKYGDNQRAIRL